MTVARSKVVELILIEASGNDPRKATAGSLRLHADGAIDWTERSKRGPCARSGRVDWDAFWDLIDAALPPVVSEPVE